jgi:hypothetical protein
VSLAATWPLATHVQGWVPGLGDWGQNLWALWWTRQALLKLAQLPFFTTYLFYPEGVSLLFHPLDVADGLLALPLYGLWGGDVAYNLVILLSFVLAGWGAYGLALYLTGQRAASFVAGLIFALSPYHFQRVDLGHLNLATIQWLPFYTLFLLKFVEQRSWRAAGLAIFFLVFMALHSWYYVMYAGLLSLAVIFWPGRVGERELEELRKETERKAVFFSGDGWARRVGRVGVVLGGAGIILLPLLWPMLQLLGTTTLIGAHEPLRHSVDLRSFWVPGPPSAWANRFEEVWVSYAAQNREPGASAYLGYMALALSLVGLVGRRWRRQALWWLTTAISFTVLALGPQLQMDGRILEVWLPYSWLAQGVSLFAVTGIPGRFVVMTSLALAMLAAYGLSYVSSQISPVRPPLRLWVCLGVGLLIGLEYLVIPLRLTSTRVDTFYQSLAADPAAYALIDIKWDANFLMHAQTVHGKPLIGGWLARLPQEQAAYLEQESLDRAFLYLLLGPEAATLTEPATIAPAVQTALAARDVRYIIDHNRTAGSWLEQFVGWPVVYEDEEMVVYGHE